MSQLEGQSYNLNQIECLFPLVRASLSSASGPPQQVSPNLSFHAAAPGGSPDRPLVLLYSWLVAKAKHMHKFGDFYLQEGCDVLHIQLRPMQLLWPARSHAVAKQILDFATTKCPAQPIVAHGFSVGIYLYTETLVQILREAQYRHVADRIQAQIFDSPVDLNGVPFGVGNAVTTNLILKKTIELSIRSYLATFQKSVTQHYEHASKTIKENSLKIPTLCLYSHADIVSEPATSDDLIHGYQKQGIFVQGKCWEDSKHVEHYMKYPTEYLETISRFLKQVMYTEQHERIVMAQ